MIHEYTIRDILDDDHIWLVELHNDPEVLKNVTNPTHVTLKSHLIWWNKISNNDKEIRKIFTVDGHRVGFTKFYSIDRVNFNCVLGADIHKDFRGNGYAKHMWSLMINFCFNDLKMHRISLTSAEYNKIGYRVYAGIGFKEEGKLIESLCRDNSYHDQICMYMLKNDWISAG